MVNTTILSKWIIMVHCQRYLELKYETHSNASRNLLSITNNCIHILQKPCSVLFSFVQWTGLNLVQITKLYLNFGKIGILYMKPVLLYSSGLAWFSYSDILKKLKRYRKCAITTLDQYISARSNWNSELYPYLSSGLPCAQMTNLIHSVASSPMQTFFRWGGELEEQSLGLMCSLKVSLPNLFPKSFYSIDYKKIYM